MLLLSLIYSCAAAPRKDSAPVKTEREMYLDEQKKKSIEVFTEILKVTSSATERKEVLPKVEKMYKKIIAEYPETGLAHESYWRLITIYAEDYSPPEYEKIEQLYSEFLLKYPRSHMRQSIENTMAKSYFDNGKWEKLLALTKPFIDNYKEKETMANPYTMFYYAEANYYLKNFDEARRIYIIIEEKFPNIKTENKWSKVRLKELKRMFKREGLE